MRGYKYIKDDFGLPYFDSGQRVDGTHQSYLWFYVKPSDVQIAKLKKIYEKAGCVVLHPAKDGFRYKPEELIQKRDYPFFDGMRVTVKNAEGLPDLEKYPLMKHSHIGYYQNAKIEILKICPKMHKIKLQNGKTKYVYHDEIEFR